MLRWVCLEAGCEAEITAPDADTLVERAQTHVGDAHGSFELEDVILAAAEPAAEPGPNGAQPG